LIDILQQLSTIHISIVEKFPKAISNEFDPSRFDLLSEPFNPVRVIQKALYQTTEYCAILGNIIVYILVVSMPIGLLVLALLHIRSKFAMIGQSKETAANCNSVA
jgi:hypothetical protein